MAIVFTRNTTFRPPSGVLAGPGVFTLSVSGDKYNSVNYNVNVTLKTEFASGFYATFRIQSQQPNGTWITHRSHQAYVKRDPSAGNFNGDGICHTSFDACTDSNRPKMRVQVTALGQTFACNTWNEGNM
ncbi:hypothetical protein [Geobacillus phage GR1]|nr:hypothetical protein [Geobacillus phage GR1]